MRSRGRWSASVRLAVDLIGAGAILEALSQDLSPEARVARVDIEQRQEVVRLVRVDVEFWCHADRQRESLGDVLAVGEADPDGDVDNAVVGVAEVTHGDPVHVVDVRHVLVGDLNDDDVLVEHAVERDVRTQRQRCGRAVRMGHHRYAGNAGDP